jgi:hypothetical protein
MAFTFEKLLVYQKAVFFADQIAVITAGFPRGYFFVADQLNRAAATWARSSAVLACGRRKGKGRRLTKH